MIRHILTLFWNQKRKYGGMFFEQTVVFIILIFCFVNVGETLSSYYTSGLLDTRNTLIFGTVAIQNNQNISREDREKMMDRLCDHLRENASVVAVSKNAFFAPYVRLEYMNPMDSVEFGEKTLKVYVKGADKNTIEVFGLKMEEGTWLSDQRFDDGTYPAVVTRQLADEFGWQEVIGRQISYDGKRYTIVGVIPGLKQEPWTVSQPTVILPCDALGIPWIEYTVKVKENKIKEFDAILNREFNRFFGGTGIELSATSLEGAKSASMMSNIIDVGAILIPTIFLLIFAFIGTFGLFWLYSLKRRKEFALRLVLGSTKRGLYWFVIGESLLLSLSALLPGMILFCMVYTFNMVNMLAFGAACSVMILFAVFSAWFPAYKVAGVNPVEAMREK